VWLVPMANILAVRSRRHSFNLGPEENNSINPEKLHNMQRHWPGDPQGNDTARLAYALDQTILRHCTHMVDMHCWNQFAAAEALSEESHEPSRSMGDVTTTRFISYRNTTIPESNTMMISQMMLKRGAGVHVMELSGQFQIQEKQVVTGLSSMVNIARLLNMIEGEPQLIEGKRAVRTADNTHEIKAASTGLFVPSALEGTSENLGPDDFIEEGQLLGHIIRENDLETVPVIAPVSGYIRQLGACHWGLCDASLPAQHPYTEEGERLALIVTV
ncbi:MAG: succinylglutamate desuccinylase/aspartoacylase family protein, partial [Prolixibacteraceae bacterium]|nr:succinylglutamate desuccinylase/aspartoacylase family protein [Prolixibacteraceae bacterium]